jgi:hypothetical protein
MTKTKRLQQPGKNAKAKHEKKRWRKWRKTVRESRLADFNARLLEMPDLARESLPVTPMLGSIVATQCWYGSGASSATPDFYRFHGADNKYLEVRGGVNVANPLGESDQKGVFARVNIPAGKRLCPYLGRLHATVALTNQRSQYLMRIGDECIDAESVLVDVGYLAMQGEWLKTPSACPPNYGRYINSISPQQPHLHYNCYYVADEAGHSDIWVWSDVDIAAGEELLVDYGNEFRLT